MGRQINRETIRSFETYLTVEEKSRATVEKYVRDVEKLYRFLGHHAASEKREVTG